MKGAARLIVSIALPLIVGFTASIFTRSEIRGWFTTLRKPSWNPPNWLFAPVWTALYILMGIAFYLILISKSGTFSVQKQRAILLWIVQLVFNFFWSFIFFKQHAIGFALLEIGCLWLFILGTIFAFAPINKVAAWLLVPYISWVSFALLLNASIWKLNG